MGLHKGKGGVPCTIQFLLLFSAILEDLLSEYHRSKQAFRVAHKVGDICCVGFWTGAGYFSLYIGKGGISPHQPIFSLPLGGFFESSHGCVVLSYQCKPGRSGMCYPPWENVLGGHGLAVLNRAERGDQSHLPPMNFLPPSHKRSCTCAITNL